VLTQNPAPDTSVDEGTTVKLTVSKGNLATVPNVLGKNLNTAVGMLSSAGFTPKVLFRDDGSVQEGQVIEQNPAGNQQKQKGSTVTIVVARPVSATPEPTATASPTPTPSSSGLFP
jgi:serine/threonine-protein kinase